MDVKTMLFLGSAVLLLLVGPAASSPTHKPKGHFDPNLSEVLNWVDKYNASLQQAFFEDVSKLAGEDNCGDKFFCKVHSILEEHHNKNKYEKAIFRNLDVFVKDSIENCTELVQDVKRPASSKPIADLLEHITSCIRSKNLKS